MAVQTLTSAGAVDALRAPVIVIDDFLPDAVAQAMLVSDPEGGAVPLPTVEARR